MRQWPDPFSDEKIPEKVSTTSDGNVDRKETPTGSSLLSDYKKNIQIWRDAFKAYNGDKAAIERKMQSFENRGINWKEQYLDNLIAADDKELEENYLKYFEPQTSKSYLGAVVTAIENDAVKKWFFSEMNGAQDMIDEKTIQRIKVLDRLIDISRKIQKENELKNLHEDLNK